MEMPNMCGVIVLLCIRTRAGQLERSLTGRKPVHKDGGDLGW